MNELSVTLLSAVVSAVVALAATVAGAVITSSHQTHMKKLDIAEKRLDNMRAQAALQISETQAAFAKYISAVGKYASLPHNPSRVELGEIKETIFIYAPAELHAQISNLNSELSKLHSSMDHNHFENVTSQIEEQLTLLSQAFHQNLCVLSDRLHDDIEQIQQTVGKEKRHKKK